MDRLPLAGIRVVELGTVIAGPFAGSLLADLGAEVIKIETPGQGDVQRAGGHQRNGLAVWWGVASRDKRCITLDLKHPEGQALFRRLLGGADVLVENYRPGALERLGFGWDAVHALNPRLCMLSISGYGATGPWASRPGFGKVAEACSGIVHLTGDPSEAPLFVGFSLADTATGLFGVLGVLVALFHRDVQQGEGCHVDAALYEGLMRMLEGQYGSGGEVGRTGSGDPHGWGRHLPGRPRFCAVRCAEGSWLLVRVDRGAGAALPFEGGDSDGWAQQLQQWAAERDPGAVRTALQIEGVAVVPVLDGLGMAANAYLQARADVLPASHPAVGDFWVPGHIHPPVPDDPRRPFHAPGLGEHTDDVLRDVLGLDAAAITRLHQDKVV